MSKTVFIHIHNTLNVGDNACSPKDYFPFSDVETLGFKAELPAAKTVVYGGGQVFRKTAVAVSKQRGSVKNTVVWGIGISPRQASTGLFGKMKQNATFVSSRDKGVPGCDWVPCVSAMSGFFDAAPEPEHAAVLFYHSKKSADLARVDGMPLMSNHGCTLEEAIRFIGSGRTVISNSYHGVYWALCLGRRVICVPFSDKFLGFKENPVIAGPQDWPAMIGKAEARDGVLDVARARNRAFYDKCCDAGLF